MERLEGAAVPLAGPITYLMRRAEPLSLPARYVGALGLVGAAFAGRLVLGNWIGPDQLPFLFFFPAVLTAGVVLASGSGYLAAGASAVCSVYFLAPAGRIEVDSVQGLVQIASFVVAACVCACVTESLTNALRARERAERAKRLALEEFRHRTRNDLQSLVSLLMLRARRAGPEAQAALREAAHHALGLARVHGRLTASALGDEPLVDTRAFLCGLVDDIARGAAGDGLRPVALSVDAESHPLSTERAVQLGLVVNECVANALKYAFPDIDQSGEVRVRFSRDGTMFVLTIADDGIGIQHGAAGGLGTRLLRSLGAQLRGTFTRGPASGDFGTICLLRFPAAEPGA
jgi:two-component sensor histidine kinase